MLPLPDCSNTRRPHGENNVAFSVLELQKLAASDWCRCNGLHEPFHHGSIELSDAALSVLAEHVHHAGDLARLQVQGIGQRYVQRWHSVKEDASWSPQTDDNTKSALAVELHINKVDALTAWWDHCLNAAWINDKSFMQDFYQLQLITREDVPDSVGPRSSHLHLSFPQRLARYGVYKATAQRAHGCDC